MAEPVRLAVILEHRKWDDGTEHIYLVGVYYPENVKLIAEREGEVRNVVQTWLNTTVNIPAFQLPKEGEDG